MLLLTSPLIANCTNTSKQGSHDVSIYIKSVEATSLDLNQISNITWHFFNLSVVEAFNVAKILDIRLSDKINGYTLSSETTRSTDTMNVIFTVWRQIIIDDQRYLLNINTSGKKISSDQNTRGTRPDNDNDNDNDDDNIDDDDDDDDGSDNDNDSVNINDTGSGNDDDDVVGGDDDDGT